MRYALLIQYDGTFFSGWQLQKKGERTVQGEMERAAEEIFSLPTRVTASGRTDAGVHARGQVCTFDAVTTIPADKLPACFNCHLPPDVRVLACAVVPADFDCTRHAKKKTYLYRAYFAPCELPLCSRYAARLTAKPDVGRMREAAALLCGVHDFKAFSSSGSSAKTTVREIYEIKVRVTQNGHTMYEVEVTGNGFLYNMVRIIAGELFAVGCGKPTQNILQALETGRRTFLAKTMPAAGLTLQNVDYGIPLFSDAGEE